MWRRKVQRPPPNYEDVRLVAEVLSRINVDLIERHFGVGADIANEFMERLVAERRFGGLNPDGWHYPPARKLRGRQSPAKSEATNKLKNDDCIPDQPEMAEDLALRIAELDQERYALRAKVRRLRDAGKTVLGQREHWKSRAIVAEELLKVERNRVATCQGRFDALRRLIAKELHPDFCNGGQLEKLMRQECFKKVWPEIERLTDRG